MTKQDIYTKITDIAIKGLEEKGLTWFKTWTSSDGSVEAPMNHVTGRLYRGMNVFITTSEMTENEYEHNEWIGFKQAKELGYKIGKGEKGTELYIWFVMFYDREKSKWIYKTEFKKLTKNMSEEQIAKRFHQTMVPKGQYVWNIAQLDGDIKPKREKKEIVDKTPNEVYDFAESVYNEMENAPSLRHYGDRAYYRPSAHHIQMPKMDDFETSDNYYGVLYHEMIHSTGHESILNRSGVAGCHIKFGTREYSKEELIAEIGSMMLSSIVGLDTGSFDNSKAYINGWVEYLKNHKKEIIMASSQAQKAVDYILGEGK